MSIAKDTIKSMTRFGTPEEERLVVEFARARDPSEGWLFQRWIKFLNLGLARRKPNSKASKVRDIDNLFEVLSENSNCSEPAIFRIFNPTEWQQTLYLTQEEKRSVVIISTKKGRTKR